MLTPTDETKPTTHNESEFELGPSGPVRTAGTAEVEAAKGAAADDGIEFDLELELELEFDDDDNDGNPRRVS